ncbi:nicotinamide riboside transporter PnuC [Glaciecola petra]|uniref:Nicotinamide riboside transporter PnuC n=1 Tax=Glaciecola petra TaxID=3075602 RepID=A0ABU2ZM78_9ALTE|nr:nicotinamide riboside transporter PnuC [Aestuariibacter sp. P117]MDT0593351.1 nicotinamide riboside transporter PnuC [Aestuariibacter sp. P117]
MTLEQFISGFLGASTIEIVAAVSGFICIFLIIKRNIWCWFFGLIQVSLYTYIFFNINLYSDAALNVVYIFLQFYGWWNWRANSQSTEQQADLVVEHGTLIHTALWTGVALLTSVILGYVMANKTDASFAYLDAFTTCTSLVAQFLLTRRYLVNWTFWIVVDVVAIYVYYQKGLYPTSLLYFTFLVMCFFGQYSWWKQHKKQTSTLSEYQSES